MHFQIRIVPVVVVVAGDHRPRLRAVGRRFLVQRQDRVEEARVLQPLGDRLAAEQSRLGHREPIQIDVATFGPMHGLAIDDVGVAGEDRLGGWRTLAAWEGTSPAPMTVKAAAS